MQKHQEKYRVLFESIEDGFCILKMVFDEDDNPVNFYYLETNPAFEKHTGLKDVEGKSVKKVLPDIEDNWFRRYGKVALTGEPVRFENFSDDLKSWFEVYAFRIGNPEEQKVAAFFKNITERKQAEKERKQLLQQVKADRKQMLDIFEHAPSFMGIMRGPDHVIERVNKLFMKLVGEREIVGKPVREAIPESVEQGFIDLLDKVYQTGESFIGTDMEVMLQRGTGDAEKRYIDFVYQPIYDSDEAISGVFMQGIDLTERKRAQEALKAVNETLEERVEERTEALLSYQEQLRSLVFQLSRTEINQRQQLATELHDNLGQLLALSKMKIEALQKEYGESAASNIDELKKLINEALTYTRELTSDLKPPPSIHDDLIASINWVAEKLKKRGLTVIIEDDGRPKPLDEKTNVMIIPSIRELLFNVIKHTSEKEAIVDLKRSGDQLHITVKDKGEGFDTESKEFVPNKKGGFGLFNIQERISLHGGSVDIESSKGKGTKVTMHIPLSEEDKKEAFEQIDQVTEQEKTRPTITGQEEKIKVLLVDDHRMFRNGLRKIIEEQDDLTVVGEAGDGKEAVNLSRKISPDVILMDVNMPKMDGIEASRKISSDMPDIRIIGVSLHDSPEVIQEIRNAGASAYLKKTEAFESLIVTIRAEASA